MASRQIFLDTTAFADRLFQRREIRERIFTKIGNRPAVSSRYVREQLRATFLVAAVALYNELVDARDVVEVQRRTDEFRFFTQGEGVKARKILNRLLESTEAEVSDKIDHLERLIEFDLMDGFDDLVTMVDSTACCQCSDEPTKDDEGVYFLKKRCDLRKPRPCSIETFWDGRQLERSRLAGENLPTGNANVDAAVTAAREVSNGQPPRGRRCWAHLSDAVILLESDPESTVLTSNVKDFHGLAKIVGGDRTVETYL